MYESLAGEVLQQRRVALDRLAALGEQLRRLHARERAACTTCAEPWPCATVRLADGLTGTLDVPAARALVDGALRASAAAAVPAVPDVPAVLHVPDVPAVPDVPEVAERPPPRMPRLTEILDVGRATRAWDLLLGGAPAKAR